MQRATVTQKREPEAKEKVANPEQAKGSAEGKEDVPVNPRAKPQRDPYERDEESHVYGCNPTHTVVIDHKWFIGLHRHFRTNNDYTNRRLLNGLLSGNGHFSPQHLSCK
jgi:hypothetical protein